jgi:hypothetical protein
MTNRDPHTSAELAAALTAPQIAALRALKFGTFLDFEGTGHARAVSALVRFGLADSKSFLSARRNHSRVVYRATGRAAVILGILARLGK